MAASQINKAANFPSLEQVKTWCARFRLSGEQIDSILDTFASAPMDLLMECVGKKWNEFPVDAVKAYFPDEKALNRFLLLVAVCDVPMAEECYAAAGCSAEVLEASFEDLGLWLPKLKEDFGYWGLDLRILSWQLDGLCAQVKTFGRLQAETKQNFEEKQSVYRNVDGSLTVLPFDQHGNPPNPAVAWEDPVISLHIPANGALTYDACIESIRKILAYCRKNQPDYHFKAIVCYSWLLDPSFQNILKPTSNILAFQSLGHVYRLHEDCIQDEEVIWRLWTGKERAAGAKNAAAFPQINSMQKNVAAFLAAGGHINGGVLLIFPDELKALGVE